jgi:hypothetical protein
VVHRICEFSTSLATPSAVKMNCHMIADTAVGMAHGTRMLARTRPLPRSAWCITSAMETPMTISSSSVVTVKNVVLKKAFQNRSADSPVKIAV